MNATTLLAHAQSSAAKIGTPIASHSINPRRSNITLRFSSLDDRRVFEQSLPLRQYIWVQSYDDELSASDGSPLPPEPILVLSWSIRAQRLSSRRNVK